MYHTSSIVVGPEDLPEVRLNRGESPFPVVDFGGHALIQLRGSNRMPHAEQAAYLREWAKRLTDMAEILDALDAPRVAREQREEVAS